jgi:hypothetical protein
MNEMNLFNETKEEINDLEIFSCVVYSQGHKTRGQGH